MFRKSGLFFIIQFIFFILAIAVCGQFVDTTRVNTGSMGHDEWITQIVSTPSGKEIISAGVDGRVAIWSVATGKVVREVQLSTIVLTLSLSPDGHTLAAGDASGSISLIDTESGKVSTTLTADKQIVNASAWSEDGKYLAAGGNEGVVRIWSTGEPKTPVEINPAHGSILSLNFVNNQLAIGMLDLKQRKGNVELWDWKNSKLTRSFDEGPPAVRATAVSPDGKLMAVADFASTTLLSISPVQGNTFEASIRLLPDSDDGTPVAVWDLNTGKRVALFNAETGARAIAFSPDGKMLACAGPNGTVIFDIANNTFAEIGRIDSQRSVDAISFSPDSQQLFIGREREALIRYGPGGLDRLFDPFVIAVAGAVRDGTSPPVKLNAKDQGRRSLTGGADIESWQIVPRKAPQDAKVWTAVMAGFNDKPDETRSILTQVIKDYPNFGEARRLYGIFFEAKDLNKLRGSLEAAVRSDPNCISCWRTLGDIQMKTDHPLDAVKNYEHVLQLKPEYGLVTGHLSEAYGQIALTLMSSENTAKTMAAGQDALTHALTLRPGVAQFYANFGSAYYFRGDFDKSIGLLLIAKRLRPDHARIYYDLGHAYRYKGDKQHALEAYRRYVEMGEEGEEDRVEKAKEYIRELSK